METDRPQADAPRLTIGRIPRKAALETGRELMQKHPDADSILLPSPQGPTIGAIEPLEREFGVNVMTALQAIVRHALQSVGADRIEGYGRLFREFQRHGGCRAFDRQGASGASFSGGNERAKEPSQ
jgi:hypothetical protein